MTKDDIIRMARKAGLINDCDGVYFRDQDSFERFAALVAAAEREECAKVCDEVEVSMQSGKRTKDGDHAAFTAGIIAERIRARGKQ